MKDRRPPVDGTVELADAGDGDIPQQGGVVDGGDRASAGLPVDPDVPREAPVAARRRAARVLRDRWDILLVIATGGALGSLARWAVNRAVPTDPGQIAWSTWLENVTGAFALGMLMVYVLDVWPPNRYVRPFFGVGVLGGYTTFSTYMLDARILLAEGHLPEAFGYLFGTLLTGLVAVFAGILVARTTVAVIERRHRGRHERPSRAPVDEPAVHPEPDPDPNPKPNSDPATRSRR